MKACPVCTAPHERRGIYCSQQCNRRMQRHRERGQPLHPVCVPFDCAACGKHCEPGVDVVAHASRFCSRACNKRWHHIHSEGRPTRRVRASARAAVAAAGSTTRSHTGNGRRVLTAGACPWCSTAFVDHDPQGRFCSDLCKRRQSRALRDAVTRQLGEFHWSQLLDRDGDECGICGEPVETGLLVPEPLAPTVDHVIPISRGGEHHLENVQLAHFICNSRKRDQVLVAA